MPSRYDSDPDDDRRGSAAEDREISLGTGTVLAIFLALALVCSLFFGLGYSMGRKSAPATAIAAAPSVGLTSSGTEKPSPAGSEARESSRQSRSDLQVTQPIDEGSAGRESGAASDISPNPKPGSRDRSARTAVPSNTPAPAPAMTPTEAASQTFVQVAAVSRREDADLLLSALKRRGYTGLVRQQTQDKLLHIQVGPFPTRKDAEAMRQHLITDGYNPIIK